MVVLVLDASALTLRLDPAHPNPASTAAAALLTVPEALSASARVYSIDGREQLELFEQRQFDAGAHVVLVPRDGLVPGAYYLVVETPHTRLTQPLHFTP